MAELTGCFGTYEEGHHDCDGAPGGDAGECGLRASCLKFRNWCRDRDLEVNAMVRHRTLQDIEALLTGEQEPLVRARRPARPRKRRTQQETWKERKRQAWELAAHFEMCLRDRLGADRFELQKKSGLKRVNFQPGVLYCDTRAGERRIFWRCVADFGADFPVAVLSMNARTGRINVYLPYSLEDLNHWIGRRTLRMLKPEECHYGGRIRTVCRGLDRAGVGMVTTVIKFLNDKKVTPLPAFER